MVAGGSLVRTDPKISVRALGEQESGETHTPAGCRAGGRAGVPVVVSTVVERCQREEKRRGEYLLGVR